MTPLWIPHLPLDKTMENRTQWIEQLQDESEADLKSLTRIVEILNLYYLPFLLTTGLSLHVICCLGFTNTKLCRKFFTQLFMCVSIANVGFLITLFAMWLKGLDIDIFVVPGLCPMVIFMSHFFPFLSFWSSMSGATILLFQPYSAAVNKFARGTGRGKILVICISVLTFTVYIYKTWTSGVIEIRGVKYCTVLQETRDAMKVLNVFDVFFLLLLPFVGFDVFAVILIFRQINSVVHCCRQRRPVLRTTRDALKVLMAHSINFIICVGPGCLSKIYFYLSGGPGYGETRLRDLLLQDLFQHLFYTYFALTPLIHIAVSSSFRRHVRLYFTDPKETRRQEPVQHVLNEPMLEQTLL